MGVTATNLIQGPATVYLGAFGVAEPVTIATAPGAGWTDCGGTSGGVALNVENEWSDMTVDQLVDRVGRRKIGRNVSIKTSLAEATLENLAAASAFPAPVTKVITGDNNLTSFIPTYGAVLLDGYSPGGLKRRIILRKTLPTDSVEMPYKKDGLTLIPITWSAHFVSTSIAPFVITDE